jgi:hypothetical protein
MATMDIADESEEKKDGDHAAVHDGALRTKRKIMKEDELPEG